MWIKTSIKRLKIIINYCLCFNFNKEIDKKMFYFKIENETLFQHSTKYNMKNFLFHFTSLEELTSAPLLNSISAHFSPPVSLAAIWRGVSMACEKSESQSE